MATMLALYCLGLSSLAALWFDALISAYTLLLAGYTTVFVLDPIAARRGEVPLYFGRRRRLQIPIVLLALAMAAVIVVRT
jgi:hypothetical protein